jgi:hypothetical protein
MPIKNLTDNVIPRFPRLGKLRKGGEKPATGNKPGAELSYFRFTSENPAIVAAFHEAYGTQPAMLRVYLPYPSTEMNFSTWKEAWAAGGLVHRCDGETCQIWRTPDGKYSQTPKPCPGGCKEVGRLEVILPELITAGFVGYVTLETHSLHDLMNITATLEAVRQSAQDRANGLQGIEFVLRRKKERISTPDGKGGRASREKWLVSIEPVPSWAQTYLAMASSTLAIEAPRVDMLTGEVLDDNEDEDDNGIVDSTATVTTEQPKPAPASNGQQADPPGFAIWADWRHQGDAIQWGLSQGMFDHEKHAENAYNKVKAECQPKKASDMWQCWYQDVQRRIADKAAVLNANAAADEHVDMDPPTEGDWLDG